MAVNIVTGMTGQVHITSDDDRMRNAATFGTGKYVLNFGSKFAATVQSANLVRIMDGMLINQGTQMGIEPEDYEDVAIENGITGLNRNDIIVMRYIKTEETSIEQAVIEVVSGTSTSGTASDPSLTSGNILDGGDLVDDMPLYRVKVRGLQIQGLDALFTVWQSDMEKNRDNIASLSSAKADKTTMTTELNKKVNKTDVQSAVNTSTNPVSSAAVNTALAAKANNSNAWLLSGGTAIPANADLNNYTAVGNYYCNSSTAAATLSNCPSNQAFTLKIYLGSGTRYPKQKIQNNNNDYIYERMYDTDNSTWESWIQHPTRAEITSINNEIDEIIAGQVHGVLAESVNDTLGAKNLLEITAESQTVNGVTFTVDKQAGTVTANGTASANLYCLINSFLINAGTEYILSGCPNGGSDSGYSLVIPQGSWETEYGSGKNINRTASATVPVSIRIASGTTVSNLVFRPMIRYAAYESATFAPYAKSNRELTLDAAVLGENAGKNLFDISDNPDNYEWYVRYTNDVDTYASADPSTGSIVLKQQPSGNGILFSKREWNINNIILSFGSSAMVRVVVKAYKNGSLLDSFNISGNNYTWNYNSFYKGYYSDFEGGSHDMAINVLLADYICVGLGLLGNTTGTEYTIKNVMLRPAGTSPDFAPYMYSNHEITTMMEGNENKNLLEITAESQTVNGVTFTVDKQAGTVTANGTATGDSYCTLNLNNTVPFQVGAKYTMSGCPTGGSASKYELAQNGAENEYGNGVEFVATANAVNKTAVIWIRSGTTVSNLVFHPMIRYANTPPDFVPYRKTNELLTKEIDERWSLSGGTAIPANADLNNYTAVGNYYCNSSTAAATLSNCPSNQAFTLKIYLGSGTRYAKQKIQNNNNDYIYERMYDTDNSTWGSWIQHPTRAEITSINNSISSINTTLGNKANTSDVNSALAGKVNTSDIQSSVNTSGNPVSSNAVNTALSAKANTSDVNNALSAKANTSDVNNALNGKVNTSSVTSTVSQNNGNPITSGAIYTLKNGINNWSNSMYQVLNPWSSEWYSAYVTTDGYVIIPISKHIREMIAGTVVLQDLQIDGSGVLSSEVPLLFNANSLYANVGSYVASGNRGKYGSASIRFSAMNDFPGFGSYYS